MTDHYACGLCGKVHDDMPMDIAHQKPADYFRIPPDQRAQRIKITSDLCSIDDEQFFIRGYLLIPVLNTQREFGWGLWAEVTPQSFYRYVECYNVDGTNEPPFEGLLSAGLTCYEPDVYQLPVTVKLRKASERPLLVLPSIDHPLAYEQQHGITMARVYEIFHRLFPDRFK